MEAAGALHCAPGRFSTTNAMIHGIGTDITTCAASAPASAARRRFHQKILSDAELAVAPPQRAWPERGLRYLATRFSAKEAFSKAIGLGMPHAMHWRLCEIANQPGGQPCIVLHGGLKDWFEARQLVAHISVSDSHDFAASFCVVERRTAEFGLKMPPGASRQAPAAIKIIVILPTPVTPMQHAPSSSTSPAPP